MTGHRELWEVSRFTPQRRGFRPQCDCYRTDDPLALHVVVELPGVDPDSLEIVAGEHAVLVAGRRERPRPAGARWHQVEIDYGSFERQIDFSEEVDPDALSTSYEDGMLRIELPLAGRP